jgi:glutamyl-tRNA reductase
MKLIYHGITHHNCPVEAREAISLSADQQAGALQKIAATAPVSEALILDTCNRTEFYLYTGKEFDTQSFLDGLITAIHPDCLELWQKYQSTTGGIEVVRHIFNVAAGLDSQMLGENQIISQLKTAYTASIEAKTSKFFFHHLLHSAFRAAKAVRTQTDINCGAVSISLAAVELAKSKMSLSACAVMLIGAGENAAIAAKYLVKAGIKQLLIASRTTDSARTLAARLKTGNVISLDAVPQALADVDLVVCSTAAKSPLITPANSAWILDQRQTPVVIIDIAVPRDIDPALGTHLNVNLYNIDDLNDQVARNKATRAGEIPKALAIIDEHAAKFADWLDSLNVADLIADLTKKYIAAARSQAKRYAKDFPEADRQKLEIFAESLAKKLLHGPISYLKASADENLTGDHLQAVDLIIKMLLADDRKEQGDG